MKKLLFLLFAFLSASLLFIYSFGCRNAYSQKDISTEIKATDFQLNDINGTVVRLSDYKGRIIILNFFATWCPPCRMEMPDFNRIAAKYKNDVGIVAVNVGRESLSKVKQFVETYNLSFPILMDDGKVSRAYGPITAIPVSYIIDKDFNIVKKYIGSRSKEVFEKDIKELLGT